MSEILEVPEGWEIKSLEELCEVVGGGTPKRDDDDNWLNGLIPWATPTDITAIKNSNFINGTKEKITEYGLKNSSSKLLPTNSILLTSRATIGARKINTIPMCTNQGFTSLIPKENNTKFLFYLLSRYERYMNSRAYGTTFPEISRTEVKNVKVLLPSKIDEQQKIAKILSTLDSAIETSQKLIAKEKNIKKGLMHDLLTNGIDENGTIRSPKTHKYKESELGLIPVEWEIDDIQSVLTIQYGKDQKEVEVINGKYPILGTGGVMGFTNHFLYDKPSVLIGRKGTINKPQYMETPFWTVDTLFYSKIKEQHFPKWAFYIFESINWNKYNEASGVPSLSTANINKIRIKKPSFIEQKQIANILTAQDKKIQIEEKNFEKLKELKKGLMHNLLSGMVRVKI